MGLKSPTKKLEDTLALLGSDYKIIAFDGEQCIFKEFGNYQFEVSGLNNNKRYIECDIYVWDIRNTSHVIETIQNINSFELLKQQLNSLYNKYSAL